ncbi:MAG: DUF393 domain-containing protein, partial [Thermoflavifilum sp.]|nr:DUF393 domain-containing protein [Thermoflavifilum sp.]
ICVLCSRAIRWIVEADCRDKFRFCPLQSAYAQEFIDSHPLPPDIEPSILLWAQGKWYVYSSAILQICRHLCKGWRLLCIGYLIPRRFRDAGYRLVSRHRYHWFGKYPTCRLPDEKWRKKWLATA